jgi:hypothetical protein
LLGGLVSYCLGVFGFSEHE